MASRRFDPIKTQGLQRVQIGGSFRPQGTSAPTDVRGQGYTVARSGTGLYTITFTDKFVELDGVQGSVRTADGSLCSVNFGDFDAANKTLQMRVFGPGALATTKYVDLPLALARELSSNDIPNSAGIGGLLTSNTTPTLTAFNPGTDQALFVAWAAGNTDKLTWQVVLPPDINHAENMYINFIAGMSGSTDTPVLTAGAYFDIGDTNAGGNTLALSDSIAKVSVEIDGADVPPAPSFATFTLAPGAHGTDDVGLYAAWLEYRSVTPSQTLVDLADDADNVVNFTATFRNTSVNY